MEITSNIFFVACKQIHDVDFFACNKYKKQYEVVIDDSMYLL